MNKKKKKQIGIGIVLIVVALLFVRFQTLSVTPHPSDQTVMLDYEGMTIGEFKRAISQANNPGFFSLTSGGTWKQCGSYYFPFSTSECNPCSGSEVASNSIYGCYDWGRGTSKSCCTSISSCANPFCCGSQNALKMSYCGIPSTECSGGGTEGEIKCSGEDAYKCLDGWWEIYELCDSNEVCENGRCVEFIDLCEGVTCPDKCESGQSRKYTGGYCSNGECRYNELTYCSEGCSGIGTLCNVDSCEGVTCPDKCEGSTWYHNGQCGSGKCIYTIDVCQFGCQDKPTLSLIAGGGVCRDNPCTGVTCEDYCSGTTLFTEGKCYISTGKCSYPSYGEIKYSEECGVKGYKNIWILGGIAVIIISVVSILYWKKKR